MKKLLIFMLMVGLAGIGTNAFAELQVIDGPITAQSVTVSGQITIQGGSPGAGKVLTSTNSTGLAAWQAASGGVGGSGTTNYIPKFTASNTIGNSIISDSGGTATVSGIPDEVMRIQGTGSNYAFLSFWYGGLRRGFILADNGINGYDNELLIASDNNSRIRFGPLNSNFMVIQNSGNVGIGTTIPASKLDVAGTVKMTGFTLATGEAAIGKVLTATNTTGNAIWSTEQDPQVNSLTNGKWCTSDGNVINCATDTPASTTYAAGNDLDLNGNAFDVEPQLDYVSTINRTGSNLTLQTTSSGNIILSPVGNVGIGTIAPAAKLAVNGNITASGSINKKPTNVPLFRWLPEGKILGTYDVGIGIYPQGIAFDGTNMWVTNYYGNNVIKINPSGEMITYTGTGNNPASIAFDGTNMWITNNGSSSVTIMAPNGSVVNTFNLTANPGEIAFDGTNMWVTIADGVAKITPSGSVTNYLGIGVTTSAIAFDGTNMWTANHNGSSVTKITPSGGMTTYPIGAMPDEIAFDGTNMWTANSSSVTKITPTGGATTYTGIGISPKGIAFDGTNMWTANYSSNNVSRVTPDGSIVNYPIGSGNPNGIAFDGTHMWITCYTNHTVKKILAITK